MAAWTITWAPQLPYRIDSVWNTLISTYENGSEQRRCKRTTSQVRFDLTFNGLAIATADAIRTFYDARYGAYEAFDFPDYATYIQGTRLACVEGGGSKDTITDSSSGFVTAGFDDTHDIWITGSGQGNDTSSAAYDVYSVAAGTVTLDADEDLTAESANSSLIVYKAYSVRFVEDSLVISNITNAVCSLSCSLIEVI